MGKPEIIEASLSAINKLTGIADDIFGYNNIKNIFEFGSRYGEDSIVFAQKYPQATIYSFECNPNTLTQCKQNVSRYKNIILTEKAVSDTNGIVSFFKINKEKTETTWLDGNQGASSMLEASGKYPIESYAQDEVKVESTTLAAFMNARKISSIDILWMDIQGAELLALKGLSDNIENVKIIHLEVEFFEIYKDQPLFNDILLYLNEKSFEMAGFCGYGEYSGDAIFINRRYASSEEIKTAKDTLSINLPNNNKIGFKSSKWIRALRSVSIAAFKKVSIKILSALRKIRGFGSDFYIYVPDFRRKRHLLLWRLMVLNPLLNIDVHFRKYNSSQVKIDICIPISIKDIKTLGLVVKNALENIKHPINKIFIIGDACLEIINHCNELGVVFIDERTVLGYDKSHIKYVVNNEDRSGWLFQQLLKLNCDRVAEMENFLILDSDTIFVKPKVFHYKGKIIIDHSQERHEPYHIVYEKILKRKSKSELSFITHYMLFTKSLLNELKLEIESIHNKKWDTVILENADYADMSGFSEYELYGNFISEKFPHLIKNEYWFNSTQFPSAKKNHIKSISLHSYLSE